MIHRIFAKHVSVITSTSRFIRNKKIFSNSSAFHSSTSTGQNSILVVGGNGAMGQAVLETFKKESWKTLSLDLTAVDDSERFVWYYSKNIVWLLVNAKVFY